MIVTSDGYEYSISHDADTVQYLTYKIIRDGRSLNRKMTVEIQPRSSFSAIFPEGLRENDFFKIKKHPDQIFLVKVDIVKRVPKTMRSSIKCTIKRKVPLFSVFEGTFMKFDLSIESSKDITGAVLLLEETDIRGGKEISIRAGSRLEISLNVWKTSTNSEITVKFSNSSELI